jgi:SdrD B-like domain
MHNQGEAKSVNEYCLAATGIIAPWIALVAGIVLVITGILMVRRARGRREWAVAAATLVVLLAFAGTALTPTPAFAASAAEGLGTACPAAPAPALPVAPVLTGATVGGSAWIDTNRNGLQDPGERPAFAGEFTLVYADTGTPVTTGLDGRAITATQYSDSITGRYSFTGLAAGDYAVVLDPSSVDGEVIEFPYGTNSSHIDVNDSDGVEVFNSDVDITSCSPTGYFNVLLPGVGHTFSVTSVAVPGGSPATLSKALIYDAELVAADAGDDAIDSDIDPASGRTSTIISLSDGDTFVVDVGFDPGFGNYFNDDSC